MSYPKKPPQLKVITGSREKDAPCIAMDVEILSDMPEHPDWMPNAHAVKEWKRLGPILIANRLLNEANLMAFAMLCSLHGKIVQLFAAGETPTAHLISQYRNLINDFGLTPVAQGKVKPSGDKDAGNKFAKFKDKAPG